MRSSGEPARGAPDREQLRGRLTAEVAIINRLLAAHNIDAGTTLRATIVGGRALILYGLHLGKGERIARIEGVLRELAEELTRARGRPCPVRLRRLPLALEVPHFAPAPLLPTRYDLAALGPDTMLLGKSWGRTGGRLEVATFEDAPHVLVAGITGAGKSNLVRMITVSLAATMAPAALELYLVDLKNRDLAPLGCLQHVRGVAVTPDGAAATVAHLAAQLRRRIVRQQVTPRLVLVVDELREAVLVPGVVEQLSSLLSLGRALGVHVVAATQHPTAKEIGTVVKANFPLRLVGLVAGARMAETAADRPGTGAEQLPGRGAFLRVQGPVVARIQAFLMHDDVLRELGVPVGEGPLPPPPPAPGDPVAPGRAESPAPTPLTIPAALARVFAAYDDGAGGLRRGGVNAAVTALNGGVLPTGTTFQRLRAQVDAYLRRWAELSPEERAARGKEVSE